MVHFLFRCNLNLMSFKTKSGLKFLSSTEFPVHFLWLPKAVVGARPFFNEVNKLYNILHPPQQHTSSLILGCSHMGVVTYHFLFLFKQ